MNAFMKSLPILLLFIIFPTGCSKNYVSSIEGNYKFDALKTIVNGTVINIEDFPDNCMRINGTGDNTADITIDNLITGLPHIIFPCSISKIHKGNTTEYVFNGQKKTGTRDISISGSIFGGKASISITDVQTSAIVGKWMIGNRNHFPDVCVSFNNPEKDTITVGNIKISTEEFISTINDILPVVSTAIFITDYIEFDKNGYINISYEEYHYRYADILHKYEPYMNEVVQYYRDEENTDLIIHLRKTLAEAIKLETSPANYHILCDDRTKDTLLLSFDKTILDPYIHTLEEKITSWTYDKYLNSSIMTKNLSEEDFNIIKGHLLSFTNLLQDPNSQYSISSCFIPYTKGLREWEILHIPSI